MIRRTTPTQTFYRYWRPTVPASSRSTRSERTPTDARPFHSHHAATGSRTSTTVRFDIRGPVKNPRHHPSLSTIRTRAIRPHRHAESWHQPSQTGPAPSSTSLHPAHLTPPRLDDAIETVDG